jgi:type IV pilus assembly protein PilY1
MNKPTTSHRHQHARAIAAGLALAGLVSGASAAVTDLAMVPLAQSTTVNVLPNIFFIFDNSGSMQRNYMPDNANGNYCRDNQSADGNMDANLDACNFGDPPFMAAGFNGIAYNPAVTYLPPVDAAGNVKAGHNGWLASSLNWASVPRDGYGILTTGTTNLTTGITDRLWCNSTNAGTCSIAANRKKPLDTSNAYVYPDATYRYLYTVNGAPFYYTATVEWCSSRVTTVGDVDRNFGLAGTCQSKQTSVYQYVRYSNWQRVDIVPTTTSYTKAATRTDCAGSTCNYNEEMANFANWYAWYSTRQQMMKTAMALAFKDVRGTPNVSDPDDKNYFHARVGFTTISYSGTTDGTSYLALDEFDGNTVGTTTQKGKFYDRLFKANGSSYTPLRGALTKAGRIYAGVQGTDPVQYSCQRNYTILSTDGYWNTDTETATYKALKVNGTSAIGDMDGAVTCNTSLITPICNDAGTCYEPSTTSPVSATTTVAVATRPECDTLRKADTLADIAYYYYHTDLRPTGAGGGCTRPNCLNNVPPSGTDPRVDDMATWQHMTTFTIGLGVDGSLTYLDGYKTASSGDYYDIKNAVGTAAWPNPVDTEDGDRIDDLWHAAVNGRGTYFSARNPEGMVDALTRALNSMSAVTGSGAAAASSNLQPTAGDNYVYLANYKTVTWDGNLSAYSVDLTTGALSANAIWQASSLLNGTVGGTCGDTESRKIYTGKDLADQREFKWANLTPTEKTYFDNTLLSHYADLPAASKTFASAVGAGEMLVNFLRGQNRYEDQDRSPAFVAACTPFHRLYRDRENVLGDIVHSQPVYVKQPVYSFSDAGYPAFKATPRDPRVYVASNDGMLHAFNGETGAEEWAYVPPLVMKDLYHLAETDYSTNHRYYLDGPISVSDIYDGGWKTILVGSLGRGGRGYYALDITQTGPGYPKVLWTYTADDNTNLGFTYGLPIITKLGDGTWVVVLASGYNNVPNMPNTGDYPSSDGQGRLFVLQAGTGTLLKTINTGVGSAADPSGLGSINVRVIDFESNNTAVQAYGGDLFGNMWRFDLDAGTASKVAALGSTQPITAAPEIGMVNGNPVLFFGTGRYLGQTDLASIPTQALYGIRDDGSTTVTTANLVAQTLSGGTARTITNNSVDWTAKFGWYVNLPSSELVYLPAQMYFGTLLFASVVPSATACEPGGHGYIYTLNSRNGGAPDNTTTTVVGNYYSSPPVGVTFIKVAGGPKYFVVTADGVKPTNPASLPQSGLSVEDNGRRVMWRELME